MPHNGGRSQLNFNFLQWGGAYPFINALKGAQGWAAADNSGTVPPDTLNANGYPTSIVQGGVYTVFYIPTAEQRPGQWRLRWTGTGTVVLHGGGGGTATDGDYTLTPPETLINGANRIDLRITSGTNITSVEFFHEDDEELIDAGQVFNTKFLDTLRAGGWGVLRFLDWQQANHTNVRKWADRRPVDYAFYHGSEMRASIYAGETTNSGNDYSCSAPPDWDGLVDKAIVTVRFNADGTSDAPTLNVAGTGAKVILSAWWTAPLNPWWPDTKLESPRANRYGTLVYDADLDSWLKWGGDDFTQNQFLDNGVPVDIMLRLCEEIGAHPWFCTPYLSCDPITDWLTALATYLRDNAPSWMIPRYEVVPNETWNFAAGFFATRYAWAKSDVLWPDDAPFEFNANEWVGMVGSTGGQAVSAVYGDDRGRYQAIVGCQAHGGQPNARLASTLYVSEDDGDPAYEWVTHICITNYVAGTYTDEQFGVAAEAFAMADEDGKVAIATAYVESTLVNESGEQYQFGIARFLDTLVPAFKTWAEGYGVMGMTFYEGGWSPDYVEGQTERNALKKASRMVPAQVGIIRQLYDGLAELGCEFPSHYYLSGTGVWALFDPDIYDTPSPQLTAMMTFNAD